MCDYKFIGEHLLEINNLSDNHFTYTIHRKQIMNFDPLKPFNNIPMLPPKVDLETKKVMRQLSESNRFLAELKGVAKTIPNRSILISTLVLQEAKDSSEIENIVTTHDELYKSEIFVEQNKNPAIKEVQRYASALEQGYELIKDDKLLTINRIIEIQKVLEDNDAGIRRVTGTNLKNTKTDEVIYTPPDDPLTMDKALSNLEKYVNNPDMHDLNPLIKMAVIHYQFETIHPFYDGNGRTGRIMNVLYLVINDLLEMPVLYLSRFIVENKSEYYRLLNEVRINDSWEDWILFMLKAVEITSKQSIELVKSIGQLMANFKKKIRDELPRIYSQDLLNLIFKYPYTKIDHVIKSLGVTRITASKYLEALTDKGLLVKHKIGKQNYYINDQLMDIFLKR